MSILCIRARFGTPIAHYRATLEVIWTHLYGLYGFNKCNVFFPAFYPSLIASLNGRVAMATCNFVSRGSTEKSLWGCCAWSHFKTAYFVSQRHIYHTNLVKRDAWNIVYSLNARKNNWQGLLLEHQRTFQADVFLFNCLFWDILCPSLAVKIQIQSSVDIKERLRYPVSTADTAVPENRLQCKKFRGNSAWHCIGIEDTQLGGSLTKYGVSQNQNRNLVAWGQFLP